MSRPKTKIRKGARSCGEGATRSGGRLSFAGPERNAGQPKLRAASLCSPIAPEAFNERRKRAATQKASQQPRRRNGRHYTGMTKYGKQKKHWNFASCKKKSSHVQVSVFFSKRLLLLSTGFLSPRHKGDETFSRQLNYALQETSRVQGCYSQFSPPIDLFATAATLPAPRSRPPPAPTTGAACASTARTLRAAAARSPC